MHRSGGAPTRPSSSRSRQLAVYLSLLSTQDNFLDTLLVNRATGMPLYATITETNCTALYAIDRNMLLHRILTINWGQGGKSKATLTNRANETVLLSEVAASDRLAFGFFEKKKEAAINTNYSYGRFVSRWKHKGYGPWYDVNYIHLVCHQKQPANSLPETSPLTPPSTSTPPSVSERPFATLTLCDLPAVPRIKIDLHTRDSLQRLAREDGFTDLDHVVMGALLSCTHGGRKRGKEPEGWLNETQLQEHLRAQRQLYRTRSVDTLPLYRPRQSAETLPPEYASRTSLQVQQ